MALKSSPTNSILSRVEGYPIVLLIALLIICAPQPSAGDHQSTATFGITAERVAFGLSRPVYVTAPPGDQDRLFIVEQH
ncbi:MAG: hypothetical protein ACYTEK_06690, partial [Planctomycetota bacterium]